MPFFRDFSSETQSYNPPSCQRFKRPEYILHRSIFQNVYCIKHWPCRTQGLLRGKAFPPHSPCAGLSLAVGSVPATAAAPLGPYLSAFGRQLFTARVAGYGRGPSLRCVRLRHIRSLLPASALPNHAVLSHPLRGAYRAIVPGDNVRGRGERYNVVGRGRAFVLRAGESRRGIISGAGTLRFHI